ncbi:hypothetical protein ACE3MZ_20065 [Paenibacillus sp. WLX1005]|uniref:hypothetical protein n=1 Tax=Paenibacillus sp. WLX1005 TaxID=3243766 RepID=UPI00398453FF
MIIKAFLRMFYRRKAFIKNLERNLMIHSTLQLLRESIANQNYNIMAGVLKLIKETMMYLFTEEQFQELLLLKESIHEEYRALYIETLVEYPYFYVQESLLDEYIGLISMQQTDVAEAVRCLDNMSNMGIEEKIIFKKIVDHVEEEQALLILTLSTICLKEAPDDCEIIYEKVRIRRHIHKRSFLVSTFLLIVHPFLDEYIEIGAIKFAYSSAQSAILDKGWYYADDSNTLIQDKILDSREVDLLKQLGNEFEKHNCLNPVKANELYHSFFGNANPIDVMFTLHK